VCPVVHQGYKIIKFPESSSGQAFERWTSCI
jgi:hypothetical protein